MGVFCNVTGWPSIVTNSGPEQVFVTTDGGKTWSNITGNLRDATGVVGKVRAGGLLMVDLLANKVRASNQHLHHFYYYTAVLYGK